MEAGRIFNPRSWQDHRLFRPTVILLTIGLPLLFCNCVTKQLNHDEGQFVTAGYLVAHQGLLPYRDFPMFHSPYLVIIDAIVFKLTDRLVLGARLISFAGSAVTLWMLLRCLSEADEGENPWLPWLIGLTYLLQPLLVHTSGRAWNHDVPTAATLFAFEWLRQFMLDGRGQAKCFLAGVASGFATGSRTTFVLPFAALVVCVLLPVQRPQPGPSKARSCLLLFGGFLAALVPCFVLIAIAPRQFIFGNFKYPFLNLVWRKFTNHSFFTTMLIKLRFILLHVMNQPGTAAVVVLFILALIQLFKLRGHRFWWESTAAATIAASLVAAAIIPTPEYITYYYSAVPFMLLSAAYAVAGSDGWRRVLWYRFVIAAGCAAIPVALFQYGAVLHKVVAEQWATTLSHDTGVALAKEAAGGSVLTLAPVIPAEGGLPVYPAYAAGPFAYRVASLATEDEELLCHLPDSDDLDAELADSPPAIVMTSGESMALERPLLRYAADHRVPVVHLSHEGLLEHAFK